jgi:hypothetical protein
MSVVVDRSVMTQNLSITPVPALVKVIQSFRDGYRQRWTMRATDPFLQGGALVVDREGTVVLLHRDQYGGDHAPLGNLVDAAEHICAGCVASADDGFVVKPVIPLDS